MTPEHKKRVYKFIEKQPMETIEKVIEAVYQFGDYSDPAFKTLGIDDILERRKNDIKNKKHFNTCSSTEQSFLREIGQIALFIFYVKTKNGQ